MTRSFTAHAFAACTVALTVSGAAFGQGRVNTDIETALEVARKSGRPILAIAGKKT